VPGVLGSEVFLGQPEFPFERPEFVGRFGQHRVGQEMPESVQKRKRIGFDERMGAPFDESEIGGGFLGQKPLVTEADESVGHSIGLEPDVFGPEFLAAAPVAHADVDEHTLTGEDVEQVVVHGMCSFLFWV